MNAVTESEFVSTVRQMDTPGMTSTGTGAGVLVKDPAAEDAMRNVSKEEIDKVLAEATSGDYDHLLYTFMEHTYTEDEN